MGNFIGSSELAMRLVEIKDTLDAGFDSGRMDYDTHYVTWAHEELAAINDRISAEISGDPDQPARDSNGILGEEGC